jgi:serine/threonine protein kinase
MQYLESQKIIHRDLALRNLLVTSGGDDLKYLVKVADFGLSRVLQSEYYSMTSTKFPVKWGAPEVLEYGKFTLKSDVWSFGVLLWELWSFGRIPYTQYSNSETVEKVLAGYRLPSPVGCPVEIYRLMMACWSKNQAERPSFKQICEALPEKVSRITHDSTYALSPIQRKTNDNAIDESYNSTG